MFSSIVVGTDGSTTSRGAVRKAAELAALTGATLHVVRGYKTASAAVAAVPMEAMVLASAPTDAEVAADVERDLGAVAAELGRDGVVVKTYACATASAAKSILDVAAHQSADLVIVGNKGLKGVRRVLGSVPSTVVRESPCAVMVVHTTG